MLKRLTPEEMFAEHLAHFQKPKVLATITRIAKLTADWMRENKGSIDARGIPVGRPWFDMPRYAAPLPCKMAGKARHQTLDEQTYEHGVGKLVELAGDAKLLFNYHPDDLMTLIKLRSGETQGWFHILNRYSWVGKSMNLGHFAETGDGHPDGPAAHMKTKLLVLSRAGFASVTKPDRAYNIVVGPVAKALYDEVWYPITDEFKTKIATWKENN